MSSSKCLTLKLLLIDTGTSQQKGLVHLFKIRIHFSPAFIGRQNWDLGSESVKLTKPLKHLKEWDLNYKFQCNLIFNKDIIQ
jgi:hypothetical protein